MPYYESPSLYIDMANLPAPQVLETIAYEDLLAAYKARVLAANGDLAAALNLEQSPLNIILETEAYGELIVRQRINMAARAVMLPFAVGTDLDVLGALYNVARKPIVDTPRSYLTNPEDWQSDAAFRAQIQIAPEAFSTAGSAGAYIFQAKEAAPTLKDANAFKVDNRGGVRVVLMNSGDDPQATQAQIDAVMMRLYDKNIKPLTDVISVVSVNVIYVDLVATITLYPGPDASTVLGAVNTALNNLKTRINQIGRDLTMSQLYAALNQEGVQNAVIGSPNADTVADEQTCVVLRSITLSTATARRE